MNVGFVSSVGDIIKLAAKVYTAYENAPKEYKHVAEEVDSLRVMINKAAEHLQSTTLSNGIRQEGQTVLKSCKSLLMDLDSLIEKYNSLASPNTSQAFQRVMLGTEDIATLRARLTSNATLLSSFIRRFDTRVPTITI